MKADMGHCYNCEWEGEIAGLKTKTDGDWEGGFYEVPICPVCNEFIDDYFTSEPKPEAAAKWEAVTPGERSAMVEKMLMEWHLLADAIPSNK